MLGVDEHLVGGHAREVAGVVLGDDAEFGAIALVCRDRLERQGIGIVIAGLRVIAGLGLIVVAQAIAVDVGRTVATAHAKRVELIAITIAISVGNVGASTVVDGTGTIADAAGVEFADAVVLVVTDAVCVCVRRAIAAADAEGVELVAVAVTIAIRDVLAAAVAHGAGSVADAAFIDLADAVVHIVADVVSIGIGRAVATADAEGVELVACTIAGTIRDGLTATIEDGPGAIADAALVELADAIVLVVAEAVRIGIRRAIAATHAEGVVVQAVVVCIGGATDTESDRQVEEQEIRVVSLGEELHLDVAAQDAIGRELTDQHPAIGIGDAVGIAVEHVPHSAHDVVDGNVGPWHARTGVKQGGPALTGRLHHGRIGLSVRGVGRAIDADGDPAVIGQVGECRQEQRIDIGWRCSAEGILIE